VHVNSSSTASTRQTCDQLKYSFANIRSGAT
jgi:hypothetical protein